MFSRNQFLIPLFLVFVISTVSRSMENIDSKNYAQLLLDDDLYYVDKTYKAAIVKKTSEYKAVVSKHIKYLDTVTPVKLKEVDARTRYKLLAYDDGYGVDSVSKSAMVIAKQLRLYELEQNLKNFCLITAIEKSDMPMVKQLLNNGAEIDWIYLDEPALHCACKQGSIKIAKLLLEKGANVNLKHGGALTPLLIAIFQNNLNLLALLLSRVEIKTTHALAAAVNKNNLSLVKMLIRSGIAPVSIDLSLAAESAHVKVLEYLLWNTTFKNSKHLIDEKYYEKALKTSKKEMADYLLFIADFHKAIKGSMLFNVFAQKHLINPNNYVSMQKLLGLDEKGDFSKAFCNWEQSTLLNS